MFFTLTDNNVFFAEFVAIHLTLIVTRTTTGRLYPFTAVLRSHSNVFFLLVSFRMVFPGVCPFRAPTWCPSGGWRHARGSEHCRGEPGSALSGGYAPDSAKAEGSLIVDEPGEG